MMRVNRTKRRATETTLGPEDGPEKWGPDEDLPGGSVRVTAAADGAYICVAFGDGRPKQEHTLKSGAKVTFLPDGSVRIRGETV